MSWIELIADRKIRDAQDEGRFDNLPGKGRPLRLDPDGRTPVEQRWMNRILKESGFLPDWIELEKELRVRRGALEQRVAAFAARRGEDLAAGAAVADRRRELFLLRCAEELRGLNDLIDRLNLVVPLVDRRQARVDARGRMRELEERFPACRPREAGALWKSVLREEKAPVRLGNRMPVRRRSAGPG
jgi:DnaJ family protein C protein 28